MSTVLQRKPASQSVLRWAVGWSDGPRSSVWRLWGNKKDDIYVAVRSLGGTTKASFHRDGRCQVGFTDKYLVTASRRFAVQSRHREKWRLPSNQAVRILQVLVPHSELRSFIDRNPRDVTWWTPPPEGSVAVVSIFLTGQDVKPSLPSGSSTAIIVGKVRTSTRTAWAIYSHHPLDGALAKLVDVERTKLAREAQAASLPQGTRAVLWESREDHDRHVLELACQ